MSVVGSRVAAVGLSVAGETDACTREGLRSGACSGVQGWWAAESGVDMTTAARGPAWKGM